MFFFLTEGSPACGGPRVKFLLLSATGSRVTLMRLSSRSSGEETLPFCGVTGVTGVVTSAVAVVTVVLFEASGVASAVADAPTFLAIDLELRVPVKSREISTLRAGHNSRRKAKTGKTKHNTERLPDRNSGNLYKPQTSKFEVRIQHQQIWTHATVTTKQNDTCLKNDNNVSGLNTEKADSAFYNADIATFAQTSFSPERDRRSWKQKLQPGTYEPNRTDSNRVVKVAPRS